MQRAGGNFSLRIYQFLLFAYPASFRNAFGVEMVQTFRDCYRAESRVGGRAGLLLLWSRTLMDLFLSAVKEHSERTDSVMKNLRKDVTAVLGCVLVIVAAFILLGYGRKHEVSSIITLGYFLDALVVTGIVGNLIVFLLAKTTKLVSLRVAFTTFLVVHALPLLLLVFIAGRNDPRFNLAATAIGYVGSFLFWMFLHWMWSKTNSTWSQQEAK
jgi:hypothetical protein